MFSLYFKRVWTPTKNWIIYLQKLFLVLCCLIMYIIHSNYVLVSVLKNILFTRCQAQRNQQAASYGYYSLVHMQSSAYESWFKFRQAEANWEKYKHSDLPHFQFHIGVMLEIKPIVGMNRSSRKNVYTTRLKTQTSL